MAPFAWCSSLAILVRCSLPLLGPLLPHPGWFSVTLVDEPSNSSLLNDACNELDSVLRQALWQPSCLTQACRWNPSRFWICAVLALPSLSLSGVARTSSAPLPLRVKYRCQQHSPRCSCGCAVLRTVRMLLGVQSLTCTDDHVDLYATTRRIGCSMSWANASASSSQLHEHKKRLQATQLCVQHMTSVIYRALHNSVLGHELTGCQVSKLFTLSLTSCTFARAVLNSLYGSTHSIWDISLVGFTCKLDSSRTVMIRSSCNWSSVSVSKGWVPILLVDGLI